MNELKQAVSHFQRGAYGEALALLQRLAVQEPTNAEVQQYLAMTLCRLGQYAEAEAPARIYLRLRPMAAEGYYILAQSLRHQGRLNEARRALKGALNLDPLHSQAQAELQWLEAEQKQVAAPSTPAPATSPFAPRSVSTPPAHPFAPPGQSPNPVAEPAGQPFLPGPLPTRREAETAPVATPSAAPSPLTAPPPGTAQPSGRWPLALASGLVLLSTMLIVGATYLPRWTGRPPQPDPEPQLQKQQVPVMVSQSNVPTPPQQVPGLSQPAPTPPADPSLNQAQSAGAGSGQGQGQGAGQGGRWIDCPLSPSGPMTSAAIGQYCDHGIIRSRFDGDEDDPFRNLLFTDGQVCPVCKGKGKVWMPDTPTTSGGSASSGQGNASAEAFQQALIDKVLGQLNGTGGEEQ